MSDRERVLEVKASVELTFHFPLAEGGSPHVTAENVLEESDWIRYVDSVEIDQSYPIEKY